MREFKRADRLNEQIRRLVAEALEEKLAEFSGGMLTFTSVELSRDLRYAKIFYSFLGSDEDRQAVVGFLARERKRTRSRVGKNLFMRHIPELSFHFDPSVEQGMHIERLLNSANMKNDDSQDD